LGPWLVYPWGSSSVYPWGSCAELVVAWALE
jgi:hypothetical protein